MDLTKNPLENAQSLLENTQANRRSREKANDTGMMFNLAGRFLGGMLQQRQEEKFKNFMNQEGILTERALVRSAVDRAQLAVQRGQAAAAHTNGKEDYFLNDLSQQIAGSLNAQLSKDGKPYNQQDVARISKKLAADNLNDYIKAFDDEYTAAQNVLNATGADRLAYGKALRDASGVDQGVMGRVLRKATSVFMDPEDRDTGRALNKTITASTIYNASKDYQETYDKYYNETGSSLVSSIIADRLEKDRDQIREMRATPKMEAFNLDGMGDRDYLVVRGVPQPGEEEGRIISIYDPKYEEYVSLEGALGNRNSTRRAKRIVKEEADDYLAQISQADPTLSNQMMGLALRGIDTSGSDRAPQGVVDNAMRRAATDVHFYERGLRRDFGDMQITPEQLTRIATRAYIIDRELNNGRSALHNVEREFGGTNPLLTYLAVKDETEGDLAVLDPGLEDTLKTQIGQYLTQVLPNQSPYRGQEIYNIVEKNSGGFFSGSDYNFKDLTFKREDAQGNKVTLSVQDLVAEAIVYATRREMPQVKDAFYFVEIPEQEKEELRRKHQRDLMAVPGGFADPSATMMFGE
ncbi:MAG: hypothetical protein CL833_02055 [Crocinitomicaceae bacterium]|nr:hypothetical protein [Crocinitomicaceae bacterium]